MITLSIVSWSPKQYPYLYLCLDLHRILFFSFFFSKLSTWSSSHVDISSFYVIITITWVPPCFTLGLHQPSSYHSSWQRLVHRFHQLSKTKLGLSIFPFLVIDDNLFTKIFNKIFLDSCCLPKHITMCKGYGQVSSTQVGSIGSPIYVLRVWI